MTSGFLMTENIDLEENEKLTKVKELMLKCTILSFAVLFAVAGAVMPPMMGSLSEAFPGVDPLMLKQLITVSFLPQIGVGLAVGILVRGKVKNRTLAILGLIIYLIGGLLGYTSNSIQDLMISRFVVGISIGILATIGPGLIALFYQGRSKEKMMGCNIAFMNLGTVVTAVAAGAMVAVNWRMPFILYGFGVVSLLLVLWVLKEPDGGCESETGNGQMNGKIFWLFLACAVMAVLMGVIPANLAIFLAVNGLGESVFAGIVMAAAGMASFIVALCQTRIKCFLGRNFVLTAISICTVGFVVITGAEHGFTVLIGVCMVYGSISMLIPMILSKGSDLVEANMKTLAVSIINAGFSLGMVLSPFIFALIEKMVRQNHPGFVFQCAAVLSFLILIVYIGMLLTIRKNIYTVKELQD